MKLIHKCILSVVLAAGIQFSAFASKPEGPLAPEIIEAFNAQIAAEMDGAQIYLHLANYFAQNNWSGFGHWFTVQYYEEVNHARQLMIFLNSKGAPVHPFAIDAPTVETNSMEHIISQSLAIEEKQTERIHKLYALADDMNSYDALSFLKFYVDEQVQEENMFGNLDHKIKIAAGQAAAIILIDQDLSKRVLPVIVMPVAMP